LATVFLFLI